jgi:lipid-binding SYLF domain-containing protein
MGKIKNLVVIVLVLSVVHPVFAQKEEQERLQESTAVLKETIGIPEKGIPRDLINKAVCVVVYPSVKKGGFIVAASYGRGAMSCRTGANWNGPWSAPAMYALEGGSFGLQAGGQATDFVLLIMNERGAESVMSSKVKMGADASVAAGPVGREASAETDVALNAQILSYSRAKGVFAGVSLQGSTMRSDDGANKSLYGKQLSAKEILRGGNVQVPDAGKSLVDLLGETSPKHSS